MSETSKNSPFGEKVKNTKVSRATIITSVILVLAISIIIAVTVATNRSKTEELPQEQNPPVTENTPPSEEPDPPVTQPPAQTQKPTQNPGSSQVENKLPTFTLPVSGILSKKHNADMQVHSTTLNDYRVHLGIDIVTEENAPVYAAADGTVSDVWQDDMMGYCIAVKHSGNCYTIYQNLAKDLPDGIQKGASVRSGQLIATVGDSALMELAEEPHLHFEMTVDDLSVDPLEYYSEKALESLSIDASHGE